MHRVLPVWRRLIRKPSRVLLTVLEILLGTAAIGLCLNLLQGHVEGLTPPDVFQVISGTPQGADVALFDDAGVAALAPLIPGQVATAAYASLNQVQFTSAGQRYQVLGAAYASPGYADVLQAMMLEGTFYSAGDLGRGSTPVVLSASVAHRVFGTTAVGRHLTVFPPGGAPVPGTVIGVMADPEPQSGGSTAYLLLPPPPGSAVPTLYVRARPGQAADVQSATLTAIRQTFADRPAFRRSGGALYTSRLGDGPLSSEGVKTDPTLLIFSGFGTIMLLISGIGIFSIQLVSTNERTREIGMRRALGASRADIVGEYLIEAGLLSTVGAALGLMLTATMIAVVRTVTGPFLFARGLTFSPGVAVEVFLVVLTIGTLLSLYPAAVAARLRPTEALRDL